jgi:hypothetical protein
MMVEQSQKQEDNVKRGKILLVALFITFSFFFNKVLGPFYPFLNNSLILAAIYSVITFWAFLWIISFKVNSRIMLFILPQAVFFIFSQILFLDLFFEQSFGRLYEAALMIGLLIVFFSLTNIIFLTSNVFAVSSFKKIPLEAVAKTTIYLISSLSIFFATYGFLNLDVSPFLSVVFVLVFSFFSIFFLLSHFYLEVSTAFNHTGIIFWNILLILIGAVLYSTRIEFVALLVATVFYFSIGLFISKREQITAKKILEYIFILILIAVFVFYFSLF